MEHYRVYHSTLERGIQNISWPNAVEYYLLSMEVIQSHWPRWRARLLSDCTQCPSPASPIV